MPSKAKILNLILTLTLPVNQPHNDIHKALWTLLTTEETVLNPVQLSFFFLLAHRLVHTMICILLVKGNAFWSPIMLIQILIISITVTLGQL